MLRLRAAAWDDGYAIVQDGEDLAMIRPPYRRENKHRVTPKDIERAVSNYGFSVADETFDDWAALIGHLRQRFIEFRQKEGAPDSARIMRLAERAPRDIVVSYLDKVEQQMLPSHEFHAAVLLLTHLLRNQIVKNDGGMLKRVNELLQRAEQARNQEAQASFTNDIRQLEDKRPQV